MRYEFSDFTIVILGSKHATNQNFRPLALKMKPGSYKFTHQIFDGGRKAVNHSPGLYISKVEINKPSNSNIKVNVNWL